MVCVFFLFRNLCLLIYVFPHRFRSIVGRLFFLNIFAVDGGADVSRRVKPTHKCTSGRLLPMGLRFLIQWHDNYVIKTRRTCTVVQIDE